MRRDLEQLRVQFEQLKSIREKMLEILNREEQMLNESITKLHRLEEMGEDHTAVAKGSIKKLKAEIDMLSSRIHDTKSKIRKCESQMQALKEEKRLWNEIGKEESETKYQNRPKIEVLLGINETGIGEVIYGSPNDVSSNALTRQRIHGASGFAYNSVLGASKDFMDSDLDPKGISNLLGSAHRYGMSPLTNLKDILDSEGNPTGIKGGVTNVVHQEQVGDDGTQYNLSTQTYSFRWSPYKNRTDSQYDISFSTVDADQITKGAKGKVATVLCPRHSVTDGWGWGYHGYILTEQALASLGFDINNPDPQALRQFFTSDKFLSHSELLVGIRNCGTEFPDPKSLTKNEIQREIMANRKNIAGESKGR